MKCSRCGHTVPNVECYVCWEQPDEGKDAFSQAKDLECDDCKQSLFHNSPTSSSDTPMGHGQPSTV